jgi:hypothetical protein
MKPTTQFHEKPFNNQKEKISPSGRNDGTSCEWWGERGGVSA